MIKRQNGNYCVVLDEALTNNNNQTLKPNDNTTESNKDL